MPYGADSEQAPAEDQAVTFVNRLLVVQKRHYQVNCLRYSMLLRAMVVGSYLKAGT
jgi:hypothetical protein